MTTRDHPAPHKSAIYLCAPVNALVEGLYEEKISFKEIKKHGDFGLGTFDHLDGEMVMMDGGIYQIAADGRVSVVGDEALTPFACVTFYKPVSHDHLAGERTYEAFLEWLQWLLPSPNIFYAIRIDGVFSYLKVRSVPKQHNYRPLVEVTREEPVFEFRDIEGSLAGFYTPAFMGSVSVPGLHLHFLSTDRQHGGHLLECRPREIRAGVQFIHALEMSFPMTVDYLTLEFNRDTGKDLDQAEK